MPARTAANMSRSAGCCASAASSQPPVTMQAIRAWLRANPEAGRALMRENPSYVFFQELTGPGPLGALGLPVTAERQRRRRSALRAARARRCCSSAWTIRRANGLWIAQDTGGAIRGANRFDTFWGAGPEAAAIAGGDAGARPRLSPAAARRDRADRRRVARRSALRSRRSGAGSSRACGRCTAPAAGRRTPRRRRRARRPGAGRAAPAPPRARPSPGTTLDGELGPAAVARAGRSRTGRVDLHGHNLATAYDLLDRRLEQAIGDGARLLLLITGKPPRRRRGQARRDPRGGRRLARRLAPCRPNRRGPQRPSPPRRRGRALHRPQAPRERRAGSPARRCAARARMSSTAAASSSLCMVALGRPKSTTGQSAIRKRPSEVPPWVESARRLAGLGLDRRADDLVDRPGRGQEGLAGDLRLDRRAGRGRLGGAADQRRPDPRRAGGC